MLALGLSPRSRERPFFPASQFLGCSETGFSLHSNEELRNPNTALLPEQKTLT
jgi:hypothetical protein